METRIGCTQYHIDLESNSETLVKKIGVLCCHSVSCQISVFFYCFWAYKFIPKETCPSLFQMLLARYVFNNRFVKYFLLSLILILMGHKNVSLGCVRVEPENKFVTI